MLFIRKAWIAFLIALLPILSMEAADQALPIPIPFRINKSSHLIVRAKINNKGPFNFILDTGAPVTFFAAEPGKMDALHARFRDHTCKLFEKHGITIIGFWKPTDKTKAEDMMVYILAYPSKEAADASWKAFRADPVWNSARDASEKNGKLVKKVESVFLNPTDYSPIK